MRPFLIIDTETAPVTPSSECRPSNMRVYDIGCIVADMDGQVFESKSMIVTDTFFNERLMQSAYYADKRPQYERGLYREWIPVSFRQAQLEIRKLLKEYHIRDIWAYNVAFDVQALNSTIRDYSNGYAPFFFPYGLHFRDIWTYAANTITGSRKYVKWCISNNFVSEKGTPSTSAETVFRYLVNDPTFVEAHTGLSDCNIELYILQACHKRHGTRPKKVGGGWRPAAKIAKEIREKEKQ